ncbi:MAG: hypothetical protein IPK72_07920 [Candidatus Eisenbacteria bacterium]|nr:hypothetical protein [Candidatus Eisenbacteria bacterium]
MSGATLAFGFDRVRAAAGDGDPIRVDGEAIEPLEGGIDRVTLRFQSHPGENWGGLARIASGGELSRVLLALESAARTRSGSAWVFDEIDAGIGGETANRVAAHLEALAVRSQVLLVTHLPVIAARATRHLAVRKETAGRRVSAAVISLAAEQRVAEIAHMLSGEAASEAALEHARALIAGAGSESDAHDSEGARIQKGLKRSRSETVPGQAREGSPAPTGRPVQTGRRVR